MAVKIVEDSAVLTLDFWDKETIVAPLSRPLLKK